MGNSDLCVIDAAKCSHHIERFNALYPEEIVNAISDEASWEWMQRNVPLLECSDNKIEEIYYFRWWIYRKHIKETPDGFVVTEFLPAVGHGGKHNTINCPIGHHFYEGRWIKDSRYLDGYKNMSYSAMRRFALGCRSRRKGRVAFAI